VACFTDGCPCWCPTNTGKQTNNRHRYKDRDKKIGSARHSRHTAPGICTFWFLHKENWTICCRVSAKKMFPVHDLSTFKIVGR